jgi:hypothetical protein
MKKPVIRSDQFGPFAVVTQTCQDSPTHFDTWVERDGKVISPVEADLGAFGVYFSPDHVARSLAVEVADAMMDRLRVNHKATGVSIEVTESPTTPVEGATDPDKADRWPDLSEAP